MSTRRSKTWQAKNEADKVRTEIEELKTQVRAT